MSTQYAHKSTPIPPRTTPPPSLSFLPATRELRKNLIEDGHRDMINEFESTLKVRSPRRTPRQPERGRSPGRSPGRCLVSGMSPSALQAPWDAVVGVKADIPRRASPQRQSVGSMLFSQHHRSENPPWDTEDAAARPRRRKREALPPIFV